MKVLYHPDRHEIELTSVLYALSDPIRLHIISQIIHEGESPCNAFQVPIAKSTLSHHLRTLRESGVVFTRSHGTQRLLTVRVDDLNERFPGVLDAVLGAYDASAISILAMEADAANKSVSSEDGDSIPTASPSMKSPHTAIAPTANAAPITNVTPMANVAPTTNAAPNTEQ